MNLAQIFPTIVFREHIGRALSPTEHRAIDNITENLNHNKLNLISGDSYIFKNQPGLGDIKAFCLDCVNRYIQEVYKPKYDVRPYITQSWLNVSSKGQSHHRHNHANSFLSGVFYINADPNSDKIWFHNDVYRQIQITAATYDALNSSSWWFPVNTGEVILFPSHLTHDIETVTADSPRVSIAFNTFLKGVLGTASESTELVLT